MPEDQQSSILIEAQKRMMRNEKTFREISPHGNDERNSRNSGKTGLRHKTRLALHPPIGIGLFAQLFFDVFTSKEEILRPTLVLPHFGHFSFRAFRSYSEKV